VALEIMEMTANFSNGLMKMLHPRTKAMNGVEIHSEEVETPAEMQGTKENAACAVKKVKLKNSVKSLT
jgi:hypothetical protein